VPLPATATTTSQGAAAAAGEQVQWRNRRWWLGRPRVTLYGGRVGEGSFTLMTYVPLFAPKLSGISTTTPLCMLIVSPFFSPMSWATLSTYEVLIIFYSIVEI
jgi:hypothetical protein